MADISGLLTQKVGPLPGWAWLLVGGGTLYFVLPKLSGGTTAATPSAAPTDQTFLSGYQTGYTQGAGSVTAGATGPQGPAGPAGPTGAAAGSQSFDAWWQQNQASVQPQKGEGLNAWIQRVLGSYRSTTGGQNIGVWGYDKFKAAFQSFGGTGGAGPSGPRRGSRSLDPMAYFHPAMKRKPRYTHWTKAGAPADVAQQIGVHPARLQMLSHPALQPGVRIA